MISSLMIWLRRWCWFGILLGSVAHMEIMAQDDLMVTYHYQDMPVIQCLDDLEDRYGLQFAYNASMLEGYRISARTQQTALEPALHQLLQDLPVRFQITDQQRVLLIPQILSAERQAADQRLCGGLRDAATGESIGYATIYVPRQERGAVSTEDGEFELWASPQPDDSISFSFIGYRSRHMLLRDWLGAGCPSIELQRAETFLSPILVIDRAIRLLDAQDANEGYEMKPNQIASLPGWGDPDVLRTAQLLPGVTSTSELASELSIRGGTADQNLIQWQDIPVYHAGHFFGLQSVFNPSAVDRVEVQRGHLDAAFGGKVSGLLNLYADTNRLTRFQADAGLNAISFNASIGLPIRFLRSEIRFSTRRSYTDWIQTGAFENFFQQVTGNGRIADIETNELVVENFATTYPDFFFRDRFASWITRFSPKTEVQWNYFAASDALDYQVRSNNAFFFSISDKIQQKNIGWNFHFKHQWKKDAQLSLQLARSLYDTEYKNLSNFDPDTEFRFKIDQENRLRHVRIKATQTYRFHTKLSGYSGFELEDYQNRVAILRQSTNVIAVNDSLNQSSLVQSFFTHLEGRWWDQLDIDFGLRWNYYRGTDFIEPRLQIDYHPNSNWHFKGGINRANQFLYQIELANELDLAERYWLLAFKDFLPVNAALQTSLGVQYIKGNFLFEIERYWHRLSNLPSEILAFPENYSVERSEGKGFNRGFDMLVKHRWSWLQLWLGYTLSQSEYQFPSLNENQRFPSLRDHRHNVQLTAVGDIGSFQFALSHRQRSGTPYTPAVDYEFAFNQQQQPFVTEVIFAPLNSERLPVYARTDLSASYLFKRRNPNKFGWKGKVGISILNLFNRVNIGSYDFTIERQEDTPPTSRPFDIYRIERDLMRRTWNAFVQVYF